MRQRRRVRQGGAWPVQIAWRRRASIALTFVVLAGGACRSGAPTARPTAPRPPVDVLKPFLGQDRILRYYGQEKEVSLTKKNVTRHGGDCDIAVHVAQGIFEKGRASFTLEVLGIPQVTGQGRRKERCRTAASTILLRVSEFQSDDSPEEIAARISLVLPGPEAYLGAHGVRFDRPVVGEETAVASQENDANEGERRLGHLVTTWPKVLLSVEPLFRDPARRIHQQGEVEFVAVVGSDGRLRHPVLKTSLNERHEALVKRALAVWLLDPARQGDRSVAARVMLRTALTIE
jgi:hypothetical protein